MADKVTSPVLFNPSELNNNMIARVDINASNAITSSNDSTYSPYLKRDRESAMLDDNGNIIDPSDSPPMAKRHCFMQQRNPEEEKGKHIDVGGV